MEVVFVCEIRSGKGICWIRGIFNEMCTVGISFFGALAVEGVRFVPSVWQLLLREP